MLILHDDEYYESRKPQPDLGAIENFKRFIWNPEKKSFLDRTYDGWAQIGLFYILFFGVIFSLFALQMWIALNYIYSMDEPFVFIPKNTETPVEHGSRMLFVPGSLKEGPGLSFQPYVFTPLTSPIIWINERNSNAQSIRYIEALNKFFRGYSETKLHHTSVCNEDGSKYADIKKPCFFNISTLNQCSKPPYGYTTGEPCVIIAFNKMFHWVPSYYNATSDLPPTMPEWLKKVIRQSTKSNVWFSCTGGNQVDKEHLGKISYIPGPGFPVAYFPSFDSRYHMSPLVAVQFKNTTVNRLLTVECTAWARNINFKNGNSLNFQIMIGFITLVKFDKCYNRGQTLIIYNRDQIPLTLKPRLNPNWVISSISNSLSKLPIHKRIAVPHVAHLQNAWYMYEQISKKFRLPLR